MMTQDSFRMHWDSRMTSFSNLFFLSFLFFYFFFFQKIIQQSCLVATSAHQ